jgi:hypothetical protein
MLTRRHLSALLALTVPACAEATAALPSDAGADVGPSHDAGPSGEPLVCDEVVTWPSSSGADMVTYHRYHWDRAQRIRTQESRNDAGFDGTVKLAWRYDSEGKEIAYAGFKRDPSDNAFQIDSEYDDHANITDSRLSYPDKPDLSMPADATVWMGSRFEHEYDAEDKLQASIITPYGPGESGSLVQRIAYGHDAAGRCETKLTEVEGRPSVSERFVYDSQNRVVEEHQTGRSNPPFGCMGAITVIAYDAQGRIESRKTWVCGHSMETRADIETIYMYNSEGFRRADTYDFVTDVLNHKVVTPEGDEEWASYTIETQTADCAKMAAAIGGISDQKDQRCRAQ